MALKIISSEASISGNRELRILRQLSETIPSSQGGHKHVVQLLDDFNHSGPNGVHVCLVLELLGPSVSAATKALFVDDRLPGIVAKKACKQIVLALEALHKQGSGHGGKQVGGKTKLNSSDLLPDLHTGNLAFIIPEMKQLPEEELCKELGQPRTGLVSRLDGKPLEPGMPEYLVWPARLPLYDPQLEEKPLKLIDFGESFSLDDKPKTLHTPLALRAPEVLFQGDYDLRVDCWSLGCTVSWCRSGL